MNENLTNFFRFPELINEVSARLVAIGVLALSSVVLYLLIDNNNYNKIHCDINRMGVWSVFTNYIKC